MENGRTEEINDMVLMLKMFEFGSWEEAVTKVRKNPTTTKAGKNPTTTKWVDRAKKDAEGHEFVRMSTRGSRSQALAWSLLATCASRCLRSRGNKALFTYVAGSRRVRRNRGEPEVKLMSVGAIKVHLSA